jgi:hypothetical protein
MISPFKAVIGDSYKAVERGCSPPSTCASACRLGPLGAAGDPLLGGHQPVDGGGLRRALPAERPARRG